MPPSADTPQAAPVNAQPAPAAEHSRVPRWAEATIFSFVAGLATGLPALFAVLLKTANIVELVSIGLACLAVGVACYSIITSRRLARPKRTLPPAPAGSAPAIPAASSGSHSYLEWRQDLGDAIFGILWGRADPARPMDPVELAKVLSARHPELTEGLTVQDVIRVTDEIRKLGRLPSLERDTSGFFLHDDDFRLNRNIAAAAKKLIAAAAADYVQPGMSVALDGGTSTLEVARELILRIISGSLRNLRVTSSSIQISSELLEVPETREAIRTGELDVWSMAGPLHASCWTMDPPPDERLPWALDLAIIGANGVTPDGFYMPTKRGLEVKRAFIRASPRTLVVADSGKLGKALPERFATWQDSVTLITDRPADRQQRRALDSLPKAAVVLARQPARPADPAKAR